MAAWQASKTYEGYADQRIWHTFSKDETGQKWGPQRIIPMMDVGRVQWSPVLHMDKESGKLMLFYSESRLCPRPKSQAEQEASAPPPPPPGETRPEWDALNPTTQVFEGSIAYCLGFSNRQVTGVELGTRLQSVGGALVWSNDGVTLYGVATAPSPFNMEV